MAVGKKWNHVTHLARVTVGGNVSDRNVLFNRIIKATLKIGAPSLMASGAVPQVLRQNVRFNHTSRP